MAATDSATQKYTNDLSGQTHDKKESPVNPSENISHIVEIGSDGSEKHLEKVEEQNLASLVKVLNEAIGTFSLHADDYETTEEETGSDDETSVKREIISNSDEESIEILSSEPTDQIARENILLSALAVQAGLFSAFQLRAILYDSISGSLSKPLHIIAKQSQPFLLAPAVVTVGIEVGCRIKNLIHATEDSAQMAKEGLTTAIIKAVTVGAFCLNALYEQIGEPDPRVAIAAGIFFSALIFIEIFTDAKSSASLPSTNYMAIGLFVDFFIKLFIFPSTIMQLSSEEEIVLIGNVMAMIGFLAVMGNVLALKGHLNSESRNPVSDHGPWQPSLPDEENVITRPPRTSINSDVSEVTPLQATPPSAPRLSTSNQTFWGGVYDRASGVRSYFEILIEPRTDTITRPG